MNTIKFPLAGLLLVTALFVSASAHAQDTNDSPDISTTRMSQQGHYRVSYQSKTEPIPLNRIHSWTLHLETADGDAVDDAQIAIYGGMPAHKHGFPTAPRITQNLGNGDYLVEGLKFSMSGHWELWLNIRAGGQTDKAVIHVELP